MDFSKVIGHEDIISRFKSSIEADRVSHAYIIAGEEGSGRNTLAYCFAKTLQCESGGTEACGTCKSCKQAESGNHPDIIYISNGRIVAAMPRADFIGQYSRDGETLEDTILRLEGGAAYA